MIEVKERLPDGTLILSNGFRILPALGVSDGKQKPLNKMTTDERQRWQDRLLHSLGVDMSNYYNSTAKM